jgi:hypothetical protein
MDCKDAAIAVVDKAASGGGVSFSITQSYFAGQFCLATGTLLKAQWVDGGPPGAIGPATFPPGTYSLGAVDVIILAGGSISFRYYHPPAPVFWTALKNMTCTQFLSSYHFHGVEEAFWGESPTGWLPKWTGITVDPVEWHPDFIREMRELVEKLPRP